jgi:AcrR family transcriptional regulator
MPAAARDRILDAARRRFAADGVYAATLEDVRHDAGVSVGAIYHHFPDKERLAEAVWLDALERYQAALLQVLRAAPTAREGITGVVAHHLRWVARHPEDAALLFSARPAAAAPRNRDFFAAVRAWWSDHAAELRPFDLDVAHALWLGPANEYCRHWLAGRSRRIPPAIARELAEAAWQTLKGPDT